MKMMRDRRFWHQFMTKRRGEACMKKTLLATVSLLFLTNVVAAPIDCKQLKTTQLPFQITNENERLPVEGEMPPQNSASKSESVVQFYRNDDGFVIVYGKPSEYLRRSKLIYRYGLLDSSEMVINNALRVSKITRMPPPTRDEKSLKSDFTTKFSTKTEENSNTTEIFSEEKYVYLGEEKFILGPCVFQSYRYDVYATIYSSAKPDALKREQPKRTILWSPELSALLYISSAWKADGPEHRSITRAKAIATDFIPAPE